MKIMPSFVTKVLAAGALLVLSGCAADSRPSSLTVPLEMRPSQTEVGQLSIPGPALRVYIEPVDDNRTNKNQIGENREQEYPVPVYAGSRSPAEWLHDSVEREMRTAGLNIVNDPATADRRVRLTMTEFWAEESPTYKARITARAEVRDATGKSLWTGLIHGDDGTVGRSLSVENYQQVLSNAVIGASRELVANPGFGQSVAGAAN